MASSKQSVLGDNFSLGLAALHEDNPTSLSMLGYIEITSHETNNIYLYIYKKEG